MNPLRRRVPKPKLPPKPKAATVKAHKGGGMAGLFGGIGPIAYVNNEFAPIEQQLAAQQQARMAGYNKLVEAIMASVRNDQGSLPAYQALGADTASTANAAAATLAAKNPTAQTNADLAAIGAPAAQLGQVQAGNASAFNPGLSQYVNGAIPGSLLASDQAAHQGFLQSLPVIFGQSALEGLNKLNYLGSQENLDLAGKKASALSDARSALADFVQKNQALRQNQMIANQTFGLKQKQANASIAATNKRNQIAVANATTSRMNALTSQKRSKTAAKQADRNYQISLKRIGIEQNRLELQKKSAQNRKATGGLTTNEKIGLARKADQAAHDFFFGIPGKPHYDSSTGQWVDAKQPVAYSIPYQEAIFRLVHDYGLTVGDATKLANHYYPAGQLGRPRLSKAAQARVNAAIPPGPLDQLLSGKYK